MSERDSEKACGACRFYVWQSTTAGTCIADPPTLLAGENMGRWPMVMNHWLCGKWMALPKPKAPPKPDVTY